MRYTTKGTPVAQLSFATNEPMSDGSGGWKDHTEWHRVVAFGKTAESCAKYLAKGHAIYFEGRLQTRSWEDSEGKKRTRRKSWLAKCVSCGVNAASKPENDPAAANGQGIEEMPLPGPDDDNPF